MSGASLMGTGIGVAVGAHLAKGAPDTLIIDMPTIAVCAIAGGIIGDAIGSFVERENQRREVECGLIP